MRNSAVVFEEDCAAGESGHQVNIREVRSNRHRQSGISSLPVESHLAQGHSGKGMCEVFHEGARSPVNQEWSLGTCGCGVKAAPRDEQREGVGDDFEVCRKASD